MGAKLLDLWSGALRSTVNKLSLLTFLAFLSLSVNSHLEASPKISVVDFRGRSVQLSKPADRVVCLIESALTAVYMLNKGERVVGIPTNVYTEGFYYTETFKFYSMLDDRIRSKRLPAVGNWETANVEEILSLKHDLIIIWANQLDYIEIFERLNIPVYAVFITRISDIFKEIRDFGLMLNAEARGEELIRFLTHEIKSVEEIGSKILSPKKVFYSWAQHNFLQTSCGGSIVDELISIIGGKNICGDTRGESKVLTMEKLLLTNPDVIIMWHSKSLAPADIRKNPQCRMMKAVRENSIYQFDDTFFFDMWTLKFLYAVKFMAKVVYPEFYSFDLEKEKRRIMKFLYGKDLL